MDPHVLTSLSLVKGTLSQGKTTFAPCPPEPGGAATEQELRFKAPVFVGERVQATVTVKDLRAVRSGARIAVCETVCTVVQGLEASAAGLATEAGRLTVEGQAKVLCPMVVSAE